MTHFFYSRNTWSLVPFLDYKSLIAGQVAMISFHSVLVNDTTFRLCDVMIEPRIKRDSVGRTLTFFEIWRATATAHCHSLPLPPKLASLFLHLVGLVISARTTFLP